MSALFLYGSLLHDPLLRVVLGTEHLPEKQPAELVDHAVFWVKNAGYPCLLPASGNSVKGQVVAEPTPEMQARMDFYEACFGYDVHQVTLARGQIANVYLPPEQPPAGALWTVTDWARSWGDISVEAAREVMACFGNEAPESVGSRFSVIRVRAAARVNARAMPPAANSYSEKDVEIVETRRDYDKFFAVDDLTLKHRRFDGEMSHEIQRAVFVMSDAVTVLPYDPALDRVLVVEQFRAGLLSRGDAYPWSLEPVAGRIDPGETPEETARRECLEEAGLKLISLEQIAQYYPSPGGISEYIQSYIGIANLNGVERAVCGLDEEGEDILRHVLNFEDLMERISTSPRANGPLILSTLWLAQNRPRLRAAVGAVT
ncbi:NUDIX domain-containing protein [Falsihalocynthiibacter sp. SS001]|uniref:NUDIX domain-containing protein n=1 Tax=Falsihalocynthiibacter sp. SS001 TaxID=3349698 RepID=UPI0036D2542C